MSKACKSIDLQAFWFLLRSIRIKQFQRKCE